MLNFSFSIYEELKRSTLPEINITDLQKNTLIKSNKKTIEILLHLIIIASSSKQISPLKKSAILKINVNPLIKNRIQIIKNLIEELNFIID